MRAETVMPPKCRSEGSPGFRGKWYNFAKGAETRPFVLIWLQPKPRGLASTQSWLHWS
jgi:hypothetical protein